MLRNALLSSFTLISKCRPTTLRYSMYTALYKDPTFRLEDLEEPLEENDPRRFSPIKAATSFQTSSVNYDPLICKFVRYLTKGGDKFISRELVDKTLETVKFIQVEKYNNAKSDHEREQIELNPKTVFHNAVENCKPILILQNVKRGGVIYQVPIPCPVNYQTLKSFRWLKETAQDKHKDARFWDVLAQELVDASNNEGRAIRKKQELHRVCEANRAYVHFRW